jgi:hypothetical protein
MDLHLTGIPVQSWEALRWTIRRKAEEIIVADIHAILFYGSEIRVNFFGTYGKEGPVRLAIDASPWVRRLDAQIMQVVHKELRLHAEQVDWRYSTLVLIN